MKFRFVSKWSLPQRGLLLGTGLCVSLAGGFSILAQHSFLKPLVPFLFLGVLLVIALRFGTLAGIAGTVLSAVIFALFLFEPLYQLTVQDAECKSNLWWMMAGGLALSGLFGRAYHAGLNKRR